MAVNKVEINGEVKLDLTQDTVTPQTLLSGATAHNAAGELIAGEYVPPEPAQPGVAGDITFYDYDGTVVTSWSLSELAGKTALPDLPSHDGLVCQGWNWTLAELKAQNTRMNVGAMYITDDGKTRIYIHLEEGRTSPMLGLGVNGTVTVDWGDGTTPDILTGTSTSTNVWTPTHNYTAPGDYVIKLTVSGSAGFRGNSSFSYLLRYNTSTDVRNRAYAAAVRKIEIGNGISILNYAFIAMHLLREITLPSGITNIASFAFMNCASLSAIILPPGITNTGYYAFQYANSLALVVLPSGITNIDRGSFSYAAALVSATFPSGITNIGMEAFVSCRYMASVTIPPGVTDIQAQSFIYCNCIAFYDFTHHTAVPTLANVDAFTGIAADCQIRVPVALVDEWKAATNWATYADYIVGV